MLLILQLNFSQHFCWTAAYEDDGGSGGEQQANTTLQASASHP